MRPARYEPTTSGLHIAAEECKMENKNKK